MENTEKFELDNALQETVAEPAQEQPVAVNPVCETDQKSSLPFEVDYEKPATEPVSPKPRKARKTRKIWKNILAAGIILTIIIVALGVMNMYWQERLDQATAQMQSTIEELRQQNGSQTTVAIPDEEDIEEGLTPAQVYAMNVNASVAITSQGLSTNIFGQVSRTASSGSGFIVSEDGYVVTNFHVISGANSVGVITADGQEYEAKLIGYDQTNDVAVLKIEGEKFPYVKLGSSDALVVGERVAAIGNPLGELSSTLTVGYVSAKDRMINSDGTYLSMIQTDAAINSGNSGGPLFNMRGEVIGITTAKYSGTSNSGATIEGISFAIPIDDVKNLIDDYCRFGHVKSGYLGIMAQDVDTTTAEQYGLPLGALVVEVTEGSCAQRAGMQAKDIIVKLDKHTIASMSDLSRALSNYEGGEEITVTVYRNGNELELSVTLDAKPTTTVQPETEATEPETQPTQPGSYFPDWFFPFG